MMMDELSSAVEAILFAAGESVPLARLSLVLGVDEERISQTVDQLSALYASEGHGMRILRLDEKVQMCSAPERAGVISACLEQRKPPMLSQPALETLAVVAYFQPVTRAYIEQVRGVDSSYTVSVLVDRGLIEECGRLEAPGRPAVFRTTDAFLRTMGVSRLSELPPLPEINGGEGIEKLQIAIDKLKNPKQPEQISIGEFTDAPGEEG
jgi:segregation and condensation protein B